ncbi:PAS and ANTAR domain-containing protein [Rhodococcus erythropolis]|uniref:PAS and ANTAR domain-containing protein n=1 Tax=Rhodococcus erythropolis TaxID=1833 RepID=UPI003672E423
MCSAALSTARRSGIGGQLNPAARAAASNFSYRRHAVDVATGQVSECEAPGRVGRLAHSRERDRREWSDEIAKMLGYTPGTVVPTRELSLSHQHRDELRRTLTTIQTAGGSFSSRFRIIDASGAMRSLIAVGVIIGDENDSVTRSYGFIVDVTDTSARQRRNRSTGGRGNQHVTRNDRAGQGILMVVNGISARTRLFGILVRDSQHRNVKLRQVPEQLIEHVRADFVLPTELCAHFDLRFLRLRP